MNNFQMRKQKFIGDKETKMKNYIIKLYKNLLTLFKKTKEYII